MALTIPKNEIELIILFAQQCVFHPDIQIIFFSGTYPDGIVSWKGIEYKVEFELLSSNFHAHNHDPSKCDLIICWENNYSNSVLPVIALNNPDWFDMNIVLAKDSEKMADYWKKRALRAEEKLNKVIGEEFSSGCLSSENEVIFQYKQAMDRGENLSYNQIARRVFGGIGGNQTRKIKRILNRVEQ